MMRDFSSQKHESSIFSTFAIQGANSLIEQLKVDPVRWILKPGRVEQQNFILFEIETTHGTKVTISRLTQNTSRKVQYRRKSFDLSGRQKGRPEQIKVTLVYKGSRGVVMNQQFVFLRLWLVRALTVTFVRGMLMV